MFSSNDFDKKFEARRKKIKMFFRNKSYKNNIIYAYLLNFGLLENPINIDFINNRQNLCLSVFPRVKIYA